MRLAAPPLPGKLEWLLHVRKQLVTPQGVPYDFYLPRTEYSSRVIVLHGVTLNADEDPRLRHFAGCLASVGVTCVVPALRGLADLQ